MKIYLLLSCILFSLFAVAQDVVKSTVIGSPTDTENSGNLIADNFGNTYLGGYMNDSVLIVKQNSIHQTIWSKTITVPPVPDNKLYIGFLDLVGDTLFGCGDIQQAYMPTGTFYFKMNAQTGALYWSKYELTSRGYLSSMRYNNGKYFLVGGTVISNSMMHGKVMAVSSQTGNVIWQTPLLKFTLPAAGPNSRTYFTSATEMINGKMFITGSLLNTSTMNLYPDMPVLIGISDAGNVFMHNRMPLPYIPGGINTSYDGNRIEYDMDENLILACSNHGPYSFQDDPGTVLLKIDTLGSVLFSKEYEIAGEGIQGVQGLNETTDSYVLSGGIHTNFTGMFILEVDKNGDLQICKGISKPDIWYGGGASDYAYGNSDFKNSNHYFPTTEMYLPGSDNNINQIILNEELTVLEDCAQLNELPVIVTNLATQPELLVPTQIPNTFTYQNGIIIHDLVLHVPCDSISLNLEFTSACQDEISAIVSGFEGPTFYWSDGTNSSTGTFPVTSEDTVIVRVLDIRCCELTDTIVPDFYSNLTVSLPADTTICFESGNPFILTPVISNSNGPINIVWNDNSTGSSLSVSSSGIYWIEITDDCRTVGDSILISFIFLPEISGLADTVVCEGTFPITLNPIVTGATSMVWNDGVATSSRTISTIGTYTLQAGNICGSIDTTIVISQTELPEVNIVDGIDTCLQTGQSVTLNPVLTNVNNTLWSNGTGNSQLSVSESGIYTIYGSNSCGIDSASATVTIHLFPELNLPAVLDTCFDTGVGFSYTAQGTSGIYQWISGSQTATELITQEGVYTCTLTNQCGSVTESMIVHKVEIPELSFPNDSVIQCEQQISVDELFIHTNYDFEVFAPWTGNPVNSTISETGWYAVRAYNLCGDVWDSIYVDLQNDKTLYLANSFTPNGDGINDRLEIFGTNITLKNIFIYNRWGEEVYRREAGNDPEEIPLSTWDGTYKGRLSPDGLYSVRIIYNNCFGIPAEFTGHVNLIK